MADSYDQLIDRLDEFKPSNVPRGMEDFIDMIAQIYNGGPDQWIHNGYGHTAKSVMKFLRVLDGVKAAELLSLIEKLDPEPSAAQQEFNDFEEDDFEEEFPAYQKLEDWIYNDVNMNALIVDILEQIKPSVVATLKSQDELTDILISLHYALAHMRPELNNYESLRNDIKNLNLDQERYISDIRKMAKHILKVV